MTAEKPLKIVLYTTSCPSTLKVRSDIECITQILNAKRTVYEEVRSGLHTLHTFAWVADCRLDAQQTQFVVELYNCSCHGCRLTLTCTRSGDGRCWRTATASSRCRSCE